MTTLTEFLLARLAEDEATAGAAVDDHAHWIHHGDGELGQYDGAVSSGWLVLNHRFEAADHITRHDPARVLAEVAAKRRIVERYADLAKHGDTGDARWVLPLLAQPYADHPDFDLAWT